MSDYRVEITQIPCDSKGDCTLHLLIKKDEVVSAVLMDGGTSDTKPAIKTTFQDVSKRYKGWGLDSIVITHWDGDHFEGTAAFLKLMTSRNKYIKYGDKAKATITVNKTSKAIEYYPLQTQIYCPSTSDAPDKFVRPLLNISGVTADELKGLDLKELQDKGIWKGWKSGENGDLLGMDFFSGKRVLDQDNKMFESLTKELTKPVFLCVGCNGWVPTRDGPMPVQTPNKNARSIIAILAGVHLDPKFDDTLRHTIPYYCAGDGNKEAEDILAVYFAMRNWNVDTMKATHHGSFDGFSHALFEASKPVNYVISAGMQYGHPSCGLLLELFKYCVRRELFVYTSITPYWLVDYEKAKAVNVDTFDAAVEGISTWLDKMKSSDVGTKERVAMRQTKEFVGLQEKITEAQDVVTDLEESEGQVRKKQKVAEKDKDKDKQKELASEKDELRLKEKEEVAMVLEPVFAMLSGGSVIKKVYKEALDKIAKGKAAQEKGDRLQQWIRIVVEPGKKNVIELEKF